MIFEFINTTSRKRIFGLHLTALMAGLLLPFSFAPYNYFWLVFPLISILFLLCLDQMPAVAFKRGWLFGFGWFVHGISWIYYSLHVHGGASPFLACLIIVLLSAYLALFPGLVLYLARRFFSVSKVQQLTLVFPLMFVLAEWFRGYFLTGFSWLQIGYSQIDSWLVGFAPLIGGLGVSGVIAFISGLLVLIIIKHNVKTQSLIIASVFFLAYGLMQINWTQETGEKIKVSLVQANIAQKDKWQPYMRQPTLDIYRNLTEQSWQSDLIIWPETAMPDFARRLRPYLNTISDEAHRRGKDVLLGVFQGESNSSRYYNTMINLRGGVYKKRHLVPLGEFYPFRSLLGFFAQWIHIPLSDVDSGPEQQTIIQAAGQKLGISLCFEDAFDRDVLRDLPEATLLVNASNDAWFETSAEAAQHHQIARMRAVEAGRPMLRVTNTGITSIIGVKGQVQSIAPQFKSYVLTDDVVPYRGSTPYVMWQNYLLVSVSVFLLLLIAYKSRQQSA